MKPSERIKEIGIYDIVGTYEEPQRITIQFNPEKAAMAMLQYLDEEYEKDAKARKTLKDNLVEV